MEDKDVEGIKGSREVEKWWPWWVDKQKIKSIDSELKEAAENGDVEFLKRAINSQPPEYFLSHFASFEPYKYNQGNLFHFAVRNGKVEFIREAMKRLPAKVQQVLLSLPERHGYWNALHEAVEYRKHSQSVSLEIVRLILGFYKSYCGPPLIHGDGNHPLNKPWLAPDVDHATTLLWATKRKNEETAMEILSIDHLELLSCRILDKYGNSPLFFAVANGLNRVAEMILESSCSYSLSGEDGYTPLHFAPNSSEKVLRLLLEKHPELIDAVDDRDGFNALHLWARLVIWPLKLAVEEDFLGKRSKVIRDLIKVEDNKIDRIAGRKRRSIEFAQALVNGYQQKASEDKNESLDYCHPPWKSKNKDGDTPLHVALRSNHHDFSLFLLSFDSTVRDICNNKGQTPLALAFATGCGQVIKEIITTEGWLQSCRENDLRLLLEHPNFLNVLDNKGLNVLHQWVKIGDVWPLKLLLEEDFPTAKTRVFKDLLYMTTEEEGDTPLHIAARTGNIAMARVLVRGYQQGRLGAGNTSDSPPWRTQNKIGDTPLHVALSSQHAEISLYFLSLDSTLCQIYNNIGESPLFFAVGSGFGQVVEEILTTQNPRFSMLHRKDGATVLHRLQFIPENTGRKLLEKFWWISNLRDVRGRTALDEAKAANIGWLVNLLMNPGSIKKEPFDIIAACDQDEMSTVLSFIDGDILHHIKLQTYQDYLIFLKIPSIVELKNYTTEYDGATPLHRALENKDMFLAKALLNDNGVERNIKDKNGTTAMDLLAKLCKQQKEWADMCKLIKVNPYLKTTYIQPGTNLDQMRSTLSVVAALLATITFAAGFTLPGGLNSETGYAVLAKKPSFLVFLLADAYAMCTSMLVLFCLIWSMVSNRDMAYLLVDRSVFLLMQSLYGTMVAFMTGIYTAIAHSSLWAAIVIFIMCSFIVIFANRTLLYKVLSKLIPTQKEDPQDQSNSIV